MRIYPRVKPINFVDNDVSYFAHLIRNAKNQMALAIESEIEGKAAQVRVCLYSIELLTWEAARMYSAEASDFVKRSLLAHCARVQRFHSGARLP